MAKAKKKRRKPAPKKRKPASKKRRQARKPTVPMIAPPVSEPVREEAPPDDFDERVGVEED